MASEGLEIQRLLTFAKPCALIGSSGAFFTPCIGTGGSPVMNLFWEIGTMADPLSVVVRTADFIREFERLPPHRFRYKAFRFVSNPSYQ